MSNSNQLPSRARAFTLIEMLVVIAIIGVLAAMILPTATAVTRNARLKQAESQLNQLVLWIDGYKQKRNHYPPNNPLNPAVPPLVYELTGVQLNPANQTYASVRGSVQLSLAQVKSFFGVPNLMNASLPGSGDDAPKAINFAGSLDSKLVAPISKNPLVEIFVSPYERPTGPSYPPIYDPDGKALNPWNYISGNPTNNTSSFDLWIDLKIGKRIYRVCNWSQKPIVL